jgi:endonuclease G, mitochondrial
MYKKTEYSRYRLKSNDFKDYAISSFDKNHSLAPCLCVLVLFLSGCSFIQEHPSEQVTTAPSRILKLNYEGFTLWLDCNKRGAVKFRYNPQRDTGSFKRYNRFFLDPNIPSECQQTSTKAYSKGYDRGHLVPANHLDYSESAIKSTNNMTNILPQFSVMNRGAWELTEEIIECYRDIDQLLVIGGVFWGNNPDDDYFIQSHGIRTPDAFWKVVIRGAGQNEQAIAWIVPNSSDATKKELGEYLVSIDDLEEETGEKIPVADYVKHDKPDRSWLIPYGCDRG